jgi:hypothetical protein
MSNPTQRKLFTRGEWLTLLGMAVVVISAALTWKQDMPPVLSVVGQVYTSRRNFERTGYELKLGTMKVGWLIVISAVVCASLLLFNPSAREKGLFLGLQVALGSAVVVLALLHAGPYPGAVLAIVGGLLLIWGGIARYR